MTFNSETSIVLGAIAFIGFAIYRAMPRTMRMVQPQRIRVISGDTVEIDRETCRVYGIEAPHWSEPGASFAKHRLQKLVEVAAYFKVQRLGRDKSGQVVIRMATDHEVDVAANLVADGTVFSYLDAEYPYSRLMADARGAYRGIWSDPQTTPPEKRAFDRDYVWHGDVVALLLRHSEDVSRSEFPPSSADPAPPVRDRPTPVQPLLRTPLGEPLETNPIRTVPSEWRHDAAATAAIDPENAFLDKQTTVPGREAGAQSENESVILIVDPFELNRKLYTDVLTMHGHRVVATALGSEAMALVERTKPDVILLEPHVLPDMESLDLLKWLKLDPERRAIPAIAVTSAALKGEEERLRDSGYDGYLAVPVRLPYFIEVVEYFLKNPRRFQTRS